MKQTLDEPLKVLLIGSGLWYLGEGMFGPLLAVFTERLGGDILEITWAWAAYLLTAGILTILFGRISDKIGKERLMISGYAVNALFTFGYLLVDSPSKLFFVQIGLGLATALATPTWDALYARFEDKKYDGEEWGVADGMPHIVTGIAVIIGGLLLIYTSFTTLFVIMGCIQIVATLYQARIIKMKHYKK